MKRKIITINQNKCNGCGLCVSACHEGALEIVNGKATLVSESYCDGFGDCLPACPTDAIKIEEREAAEYDEETVKARIEAMNKTESNSSPKARNKSELMQWPCQIKLVSASAPYFNENHLLIAADCTSYAYANFHEDFMKNKITIIGCPKLDGIHYEEKLTDIISLNNIKSVTVVRMQVPCCGGIVHAAERALVNSKKLIPFNVITLTTDGKIMSM